MPPEWQKTSLPITLTEVAWPQTRKTTGPDPHRVKSSLTCSHALAQKKPAVNIIALGHV